MGRRTSPYVIGDYWLDKRRDHKSPRIWQIATIRSGTNSITYKTTKNSDLDKAKQCLDDFVLALKRPSASPVKDQTDKLAVPVLPYLESYWEEQGCYAVSATTIEHHLRCFVAFLQQDTVGVTCEFRDIDRHMIDRYRIWAMAPNSWTVKWMGKLYKSRSGGVCGATFRRSLASVKAALNLALQSRVVPYLLRLPPLPSDLRSPPRNRLLTAEEIGAMLGYANDDPALLNWLHIMLATGVRPVAATKLVPSNQWKPQFARLDLHPHGQRYTNKRNPRVPLIPQLEERIAVHLGPWIPNGVTHSVLGRRWRMMREALGFSQEVVPKTMRHTIATELAEAKVSDRHISMLLGHIEIVRWRDRSEISPAFYNGVIPTLSNMWDEAHEYANRWLDRYVVIQTRKGGRVVVERSAYPDADQATICRSVLDIVSPSLLRDQRAKPHYLTGDRCSA